MCDDSMCSDAVMCGVCSDASACAAIRGSMSSDAVTAPTIWADDS